MHIVLGATGQVGSMLVEELLKKGESVRVVVRNEAKAARLGQLGADIRMADYFDVHALKEAFEGGTTVFLLTPENPETPNFLSETQTILANYREAVQAANIKKVVGLSSMGAQHSSGTGNLLASNLLEQTFTDTEVEQIFVRPAYYYSNWIGYVDVVKDYGVLPTFFPEDLPLPMIAPSDVAGFLAKVMTSANHQKTIYEICGPKNYTSKEIASIFAEQFEREIQVQRIVPEEWESTLLQAGFSTDGAKNLLLMIQAVIEGKTQSETNDLQILPTDFQTYLKNWRLENK